MSTTPAPTKAKGALPMKDYFSSLAYLTLLLGACIVFLPRSSSYLAPHLVGAGESSGSPTTSAANGARTAAVQTTSADRPEHPFLTPITSDPVTTLLWEVVGLVITMAWWGGKLARWFGVTTSAKNWKHAALGVAGSTVVFTLFLFLFGAPERSHYVHTILLAHHLAILCAWPFAFVLGLPSVFEDGTAARFRLTRLVCEFNAETPAERALVFPLAGTLIGAWVGAIPLALDWDRPWQAWPLTPMLGSTVGFAVGGFASFWRSAYLALRQDVVDEAASKVEKKPVKKSRGRYVK